MRLGWSAFQLQSVWEEEWGEADDDDEREKKGMRIVTRDQLQPHSPVKWKQGAKKERLKSLLLSLSLFSLASLEGQRWREKNEHKMETRKSTIVWTGIMRKQHTHKKRSTKIISHADRHAHWIRREKIVNFNFKEEEEKNHSSFTEVWEISQVCECVCVTARPYGEMEIRIPLSFSLFTFEEVH